MRLQDEQDMVAGGEWLRKYKIDLMRRYFALKEAVEEYMQGGHSHDCELNGFVMAGEEDKSPLECDCGYDKITALLEVSDG